MVLFKVEWARWRWDQALPTERENERSDLINMNLLGYIIPADRLRQLTMRDMQPVRAFERGVVISDYRFPLPL